MGRSHYARLRADTCVFVVIELVENTALDLNGPLNVLVNICKLGVLSIFIHSDAHVV